MTLNDSGHRKSFGDGAAVRERASGKGRYDLIPPEALKALAHIFELGAEKYDDRNWERGMPMSTCVDSALRHLTKLLAGEQDEDHASLALTNLAMLVTLRDRIKSRELSPEFDDLGLIDVPQRTVAEMVKEYTADGMTVKADELESTVVQIQDEINAAMGNAPIKGVGRWVSHNRCGLLTKNMMNGEPTLDVIGEAPHEPHPWGTALGAWCDGYVVDPVRESDVDMVKRVAAKLTDNQKRPGLSAALRRDTPAFSSSIPCSFVNEAGQKCKGVVHGVQMPHDFGPLPRPIKDAPQA